MADETTPDPIRLSIADVLSGVAYPSDTVEVFLDESIAYEIGKMQARIATSKPEDVEKMEEELDALVEKGAPSRIVVHIRGISRHDKVNIIKTVEQTHPQQTDILGRPKPNLPADELFTDLTWAAHIEKIEVVGGVIDPVGQDDVRALRDNAPESSLELIGKAIQALTEGAKSGFETLAQEHGFLSQR